MITSFVKSMGDFSFRGRASRKEFLSFVIISTIVSLLFLTTITALAVIVLNIKINMITGDISIPYRMKAYGVVPFVAMMILTVTYIIFNIWAAVVGALLAIKRLHDINCSGVGYWIWIAAIILFSAAQTSVLTGILFYFIIGAIITLSVKTSYPYPNKYGNPKSEEIIHQV